MTVRPSVVFAGVSIQSGRLPSVPISRVVSDTREVVLGALYVAIKGTRQDGHDFVAHALSNGASAAVVEMLVAGVDPEKQILVSDTRHALGVLSANFAGNPSRELKVIGITGTSGKTTTTYLAAELLRAAGFTVGMIGTIENRIGDQVIESTHTTPDAPALQGLLGRMKDAGCTHVVMEVSSHALEQKRVLGVAFDVMVFTNLSPEHLDYHPDMQSYFEAKALLFTDYADYACRSGKHPVLLINVDDEWGVKLRDRVKSRSGSDVRLIEYSLTAAKNWTQDIWGIKGTMNDGVAFHSPLLGGFNQYNVLAAIYVGQVFKISSAILAYGLHALSGVPGRLERVENPRSVHVFVDYAHKPDALAKVLQALEQHRKDAEARLFCVFGCGGDRDPYKRPEMGRIAARHSDRVWITSDNPRTEDPLKIIDQIVSGVAPEHRSHVKVVSDRKQAITEALQEAKAGDLVLIAGKGHETYQICGTQKIPFDDRIVAREVLTSGFKNL